MPCARPDRGAFRAAARPEGQDLRLAEPDGTLLLRRDTPDDAPLTHPEVDRGDLRDLLLDSLPAETVVWGRAFDHATALPGGGHRLHFADGGHADHALAAGTDGARSRVRALVTDVRPAHTGVNMVEIGIPDAAAAVPSSPPWSGPSEPQDPAPHTVRSAAVPALPPPRRSLPAAVARSAG